MDIVWQARQTFPPIKEANMPENIGLYDIVLSKKRLSGNLRESDTAGLTSGLPAVVTVLSSVNDLIAAHAGRRNQNP